MKKIGFIGGGNMAEALAHGLIAGRVFKPTEIIVSDVVPERRRKLARTLKVKTTADNAEVVREAAAVVLAVKPQMIDAVMAELAAALANLAKGPPVKSKLFISIAAGVTIERLSRGLGARARVIRVMPNAPAMVGHGMTALVRARTATPADERFAL
ncbi:MAG TPA: NAD(P)-binding domain-containing protein, partial [Candidatus Acidoferrales bacterium]|nr:NAD(P)-binding domain-containing protein [Candidatus Acidoferrales bacterium]